MFAAIGLIDDGNNQGPAILGAFRDKK